jgi:hypothetical protein
MRSEFERWEMPMTTFLAKAFTNKIKTLLWEPFAKRELDFTVIDYQEIQRRRSKKK